MWICASARDTLYVDLLTARDTLSVDLRLCAWQAGSQEASSLGAGGEDFLTFDDTV